MTTEVMANIEQKATDNECQFVGKGLVTLTPLKQSGDHNIVRISRETQLDGENHLLVCGGPYTGIVINRFVDNAGELGPPDGTITLSFSVWITDAVIQAQEKRTLSFVVSEGVDSEKGYALVHSFFTQLLSNLPKGYFPFLSKILVMMKNDFEDIQSLYVDFRTVAEEEQVAIPDATQYEADNVAEEEVSAAAVQNVLEHAYPNGITIDAIADMLKCPPEEALSFLLELEQSGIASRVGDEWLRVDSRNVDAAVKNRHSASTDKPTIAIITCLYSEKLAIDALIEDSHVVHKYKSGGDSNLYTIGRIGEHSVVATKLAVIGNTREAITSAGSITTRLLGNFQHIEHVFVVGVGGSVPHYTNAKLHARLGDVVVSAGADSYVYSHDLLLDRKTGNLSGFAVRKYHPKSHEVEDIVRNGGDQLQEDWERFTKRIASELTGKSEDEDFSAPPSSADVLALPLPGGQVVVMPHPNADRKGFEIHLGSIGGLANIRRADGEPEDEGKVRERFSSDYGLRAVDFGFDSVVASIVGSRIDSWALIRGMADYQHGQSKAARRWQAHAAARAAALTRAIIERLPKS